MTKLVWMPQFLCHGCQRWFGYLRSSCKYRCSEVHVHLVPLATGDAAVDIKLETLDVEEGSQRFLSPKYLSFSSSASNANNAAFVFNVTRGPSHGWIDVMAEGGTSVVRIILLDSNQAPHVNANIFSLCLQGEAQRQLLHFRRRVRRKSGLHTRRLRVQEGLLSLRRHRVNTQETALSYLQDVVAFYFYP